MNRLLFWAVILCPSFVQAAPVSIIPEPVSVVSHSGTFSLSEDTRIEYGQKELKNSAEFFQSYLSQFYGLTLPLKKHLKLRNLSTSPVIVLKNNQRVESVRGSYQLEVSEHEVMITGDNAEGVFYGIQTLIQLLPTSVSSILELPQVSVQDAPRFQYRGMHLDVGRHFFPVDFVKRYIDFIALHKMNVFHWHLTEDQGWRIEIKKYPKLTKVGGCRSGTQIGREPSDGIDKNPYCGFYTQREIKDVVKYAQDRYVTIIPEIEMPGHSSAALAAYPELGCTRGPYEVQRTWGVFNDIYCAGRESTFIFLQDVLDEVMELFPSPYIHIGGDEVPTESWHQSPECQARMRENHLKDEHELQSYFVQRIEKYLNSKGRKMIGWDEILEGGLAPNATVMSWRGTEGGIAAARQHHDVIMTPSSTSYFDHSQSKHETTIAIGGYLPVETVYRFEPVPADLAPDEVKYIMGAQANVWTEYMPDASKVEYMIFPRLSAMSEVLWTKKENKSWDDFQIRLKDQFGRYDLWKVNYNLKGIKDGT